MIAILCEPGTETAGQAISQAIQARYTPPAPPELCPPDSKWSRASEWDDLLLVVYASPSLPEWAQEFIRAFRDAHALGDPATGQQRPGGFLIPVAANAASVKPPEPMSGIKAARYDGAAASLEPILRTVGTLLGMAVRPGEHQIFISYRSSDGVDISKDLHQRLTSAGFHPWLDEAPDNLPPGTDVQRQIETRIKSAALVLVVDTPDAPDSSWITYEIDTAIGQLIPVVPVVVGPDRDVSRFINLAPLQRRAPVKPQGVDRQPLSDPEWDRVLGEIQEVLLSSYRRRMQILSRAKQAFTSNGFEWTDVDEPRRVFEARREQPALPPTVVLSHCSVHEVTYLPNLRAYANFIASYPDLAQVTFKLVIYDRDKVLSVPEIQTIGRQLAPLPFFLAHYNELDMLIGSNFTRLR